jgi:anaerobic magnesium-protoporphyrin IX monomethyl ester cyclase
MKLVLTHGYFLYDDEKEKQIMKPYPPLGILYLSAFLNENGVDNSLFDSTFSTSEDQLRFIIENKPDFVAFYCNLMTKVEVLQQVEKIRASPELANTKIIFGGPDITYNTSNYLKYGADVLVIGEGEETIYELVTSLDWNDSSLSAINGIAFINSEGKEIQTPARIKIKDVDNLPQPNRAGIDMYKYMDTWKKHHGQSALNVSTQRGCPYTCKWCSTAVYGQSYRRRSPEKVVQELKSINETYHPDTIWFVDDVFTVSHKWLNEFAAELEKQHVEIRFECISRADRMSKEVISVLKKAGCFRVWIGAESGSQKIIDAMDRRVTVENVREMIQETRNAGIEAGTFIMLGYPGETIEDIEETAHHLKESNPDHFTITVAYPIKGTALHTEITDEITTNLDWSKSTDRDIKFRRTYSERYYDIANRYIVSDVAYHKLKLQSAVLSWSGLKLFIKSRLFRFTMRLLMK